MQHKCLESLLAGGGVASKGSEMHRNLVLVHRHTCVSLHTCVSPNTCVWPITFKQKAENPHCSLLTPPRLKRFNTAQKRAISLQRTACEHVRHWPRMICFHFRTSCLQKTHMFFTENNHSLRPMLLCNFTHTHVYYVCVICLCVWVNTCVWGEDLSVCG